ncbi:MAG: uroporphyrinogen decarboxylase family protein [Bacilli bacterium]
MSTRVRFKQFINQEPYTEGVPAAFSQHFSPDKRHGAPAIKEQLDYLESTNMDILKIMFDDIYPKINNIKTPSDWRNITEFRQDDPVFVNQLDIAKRIVDIKSDSSYVFQTIFSPFVSAGCAVSPIPEWDKIVTKHFHEDPESMSVGLKSIASVLSEFAKNIAATGIDGFYVSLQGGEYNRYSQNFFEQWFKPLDVMFLNALKATGKIVFLHVCGTGMRLSDYYDYPGDVVNFALQGNEITLDEASELFNRPIMGGVPNTGIICNGSEREIKEQVTEIIRSNSLQLMIGADCTIPAHVKTENIKWAVEAAHSYR